MFFRPSRDAQQHIGDPERDADESHSDVTTEEDAPQFTWPTHSRSRTEVAISPEVLDLCSAAFCAAEDGDPLSDEEAIKLERQYIVKQWLHDHPQAPAMPAGVPSVKIPDSVDRIVRNDDHGPLNAPIAAPGASLVIRATADLPKQINTSQVKMPNRVEGNQKE